MNEPIAIGLYGFGVVGQGFHEILQRSTSMNVKIQKICVKDESKSRALDMDCFTFDRYELLKDPKVDLIVELISDADAAFEIVKFALENGKDVISANKKMIAQHMGELIALQEQYGTSLLYEASSCSSIPILRNLEEYYDNDLLKSVSGVMNASTNYILTKIFRHDRDYDLAVKEAQDLGYAEADPRLDLIGLDALYKMLILVTHAYGTVVKPEDVVAHGIQNISKYDIKFAREKGYIIRHTCHATKVGDKEVAMYVLPEFVKEDNIFYGIDYEDNGVMVDAAFSGGQFFKGKGAGGFATGSAVISDLSARFYDYKYSYKKKSYNLGNSITNDFEITVYLRYYDQKNCDVFQFEKILGQFTSEKYNYVIGKIKLSSILAVGERLNNADIMMIKISDWN